MSYTDALEYCTQRGALLPSKEECEALSRAMGNRLGSDYNPNAIEGISKKIFWSSTENQSSFFFFNGDNGKIEEQLKEHYTPNIPENVICIWHPGATPTYIKAIKSDNYLSNIIKKRTPEFWSLGGAKKEIQYISDPIANSVRPFIISGGIQKLMTQPEAIEFCAQKKGALPSKAQFEAYITSVPANLNDQNND